MFRVLDGVYNASVYTSAIVQSLADWGIGVNSRIVHVLFVRNYCDNFISEIEKYEHFV